MAVRMTAAEVASAGMNRILEGSHQNEAGDLDEERHQGRMIHITPGQMVPQAM